MEDDEEVHFQVLERILTQHQAVVEACAVCAPRTEDASSAVPERGLEDNE